MGIIMISAVARNRAIGYRGELIYRLPDDLKRFRALTKGHTVIMGRNTFESLPNGALPDRRNIVLDWEPGEFPGCECFCSLEEALRSCREGEDVYIIGGASVYGQAIEIADRLCLTEVDDTPENADAFFPAYDEWTEVSREERQKDERHAFAFAFVDYVRKG